MVEKACQDVALYATSFGYSGTYYDYLQDVAVDTDLSKLVNLDISSEEIEAILVESGFKGYRLNGAKIWIMKAIQEIKKL